MEVLARPGQPAHLPAEDDSDVAQRDLAEQVLESEPTLDPLPARRLVIVDDQDPGLGPPELGGAAAELVLQVGRLAVAEDLLRTRLADVDDGQALDVARPDLVRERDGRISAIHDRPPRPWFRRRTAGRPASGRGHGGAGVSGRRAARASSEPRGAGSLGAGGDGAEMGS